jgi:hypothetical protein
MKNAVFRGMMLCGSYMNRSFGGKHYLHNQGGEKRRARNKVSGK